MFYTQGLVGDSSIAYAYDAFRTDDLWLVANWKNVLYADVFHVQGLNIWSPTEPEALFPKMARSTVIIVIFIWLTFMVALVFAFLAIIVIVVMTSIETFPTAYLTGRILAHDT